MSTETRNDLINRMIETAAKAEWDHCWPTLGWDEAPAEARNDFRASTARGILAMFPILTEFADDVITKGLDAAFDAMHTEYAVEHTFDHTDTTLLITEKQVGYAITFEGAQLIAADVEGHIVTRKVTRWQEHTA